MEPAWKTIIWKQFSASIDMLDNALKNCPDELWSARLWEGDPIKNGLSEFWYVAYHTLFWLDLYLSGTLEGFLPPEPFTLSEIDPAGRLPDRIYSREELRAYLEHCREKARATLETLTDENATRLCAFPWLQLSFAELLLDNMRHVQEHGAQLNMLIGQQTGRESRWVAKSKNVQSKSD